MLAIGNAYIKTSVIGMENLYAAYLSVDLSVYTELGGKHGNKYRGRGNRKQGHFF